MRKRVETCSSAARGIHGEISLKYLRDGNGHLLPIWAAAEAKPTLAQPRRSTMGTKDKKVNYTDLGSRIGVILLLYA